MTITRGQIEQLKNGDMVTVYGWQGLCVSGPVTVESGGRWMGDHLLLSNADGMRLPEWTQESGAELTVISRAKAPLYLNHPRTSPAIGDVVRTIRDTQWVRMAQGYWQNASGDEEDLKHRDQMTLLVDGETGEVVR